MLDFHEVFCAQLRSLLVMVLADDFGLQDDHFDRRVGAPPADNDRSTMQRAIDDGEVSVAPRCSAMPGAAPGSADKTADARSRCSTVPEGSEGSSTRLGEGQPLPPGRAPPQDLSA